MKWMEFIKLQTSDISGSSMQGVRTILREIVGTSGLLLAELYRDAAVTGNIAFLLIWETEQPLRQGSLVGFQVVEELKKFGMVAHSIWIGQP